MRIIQGITRGLRTHLGAHYNMELTCDSVVVPWLINYDADTFITKFYLGDMPAQLFELLEVNVDRMDLYAAMTANTEQLRVPDSLPE